ncbi:MAG: endonuclease [Bacteroidales bacterium]|nr:endonuclease [Bacteroidales bacterium]
MKISVYHYSKSVTTMLFGLLYFITGTIGQIPPGYYDPAIGKTGTELQAALHNIIKNHTVKSYDYIWTGFHTTDDKPDGTVWDMYSDIPGGTPPYVFHFGSDQCGNYNGEGDCYNREHSWPKSWFNEQPPMISDMLHIYPTDGFVNGKRNNYPYGTVSTASWTSENGSKLGTCSWPGYTGVVFEPIDGYKGDFARTYFYMSTRYYTEDAGWKVTEMTNKSQLKPWALQMMLSWASEDPVSTKETDRNNTLYGIQNNRNPFIDHPEYANLIWGYPVGVDETTAQDHTVTVYPNPVWDQCQVDLPADIKDKNYQLMLISATGTNISQKYLQIGKTNGNTLTLNLQSLPKGIYFLTLTGDVRSWHGKLVKE